MIKANIKDDFKNLLDYQHWVNQRMKNISFLNRRHLKEFTKESVNGTINDDPNWYGKDVTFDQLAKGITEYRSPELIEKVFNSVNDKISTEIKDTIKSRKIKFNPNGLGVFCFDRAAMGMFRLKEYYSSKHNKAYEKDKVQKSGKEYKLISDNSKVIERWEQKPDGTPKIRTTNKNVYAFFPPTNKDRRAVELFIGCGGHGGVAAEEFLYSGMSAIIVAQLLERAKIQTKISIVIGTSPDDFQRSFYGCIVPVKNYDETLDINLIALLSSDPRFYRFEGFKGIVSTYDHFGAKLPADFGNGVDRKKLYKAIENSDYSTRANLAPNRFYFGRTFTEQESIEVINSTIREIGERLNE